MLQIIVTSDLYFVCLCVCVSVSVCTFQVAMTKMTLFSQSNHSCCVFAHVCLCKSSLIIL